MEAHIADFDLQYDAIDGTEIIETHGNLAIVGYLAIDYEFINPRREWDNFGKLFSWTNDQLSDPGVDYHPDDILFDMAIECDPDTEKIMHYWYELKDENPFLRIIRSQYEDCIEGEDAAEEAAQKNVDAAKEKALEKGVILPFRVYNGPFTTIRPGYPGDTDIEDNDGFIFATPDMITREFGDYNQALKDKALAVMKAELKEYDLCLSGEIYGFVVEVFQNGEDDPEEPPVWDQVDEEAVWGCVGSDHAENELQSLFQSTKDYFLQKAAA